jgi:putative DNA primase/helicase
VSGSSPERVTLASLATLSCWVAWQTEMRPKSKKPTKIPYSPSGRGKAKADDHLTWGTLKDAETRAATLPKPYDLGGVGLEFCSLKDGRHTAGVDLDTCRDPGTGTLEPWAKAVVDRLASYTEVSPSGTGVKVFFLLSTDDHLTIRRALGTTPEGELKFSGSWKRKTGVDHPPAIELHTGNRYFAVTELILDGSTDELREVPTKELLRTIHVDGPQLRDSLLGEAAGSSRADGDDDDDPEAGATMAAAERGRGRKRDFVGNDTSRSVTAFKVGAAARRDGADYDAMCRAIAEHSGSREWYVEKGLADDGRELRRIWDKTDPFTGELIVPRGAPLVTAKQFVRRLHTQHSMGGVSYRTIHHQNASFYTWQSSHYGEQTPEETRSTIYRFLDGAKTIDPETRRIINFDPNKNRVANVAEALAAEVQLSRSVRAPAWLDGASPDAPNPADLVACKNGLLHPPTRKLLPHSPALFVFNALPFDYTDSPEPPRRWVEFLDTIWPADTAAKEALQELFGLALTADTSHQKAFLIVGPKRCGKGTIARVLTEMLGAANVCNPTLSSLSSNFGLAPMIGKRLAIISDARLSGKADQAVIVERILAITGEDGLTIDRKFREAWTGKLDVRFVVLTNELPRLTDSSGAFASRFIILKLTRSFYGEEDHGLLDKLKPELPSILHWSLTGLERLRARGHFLPPASAADAVREMEDLGSPTGAFLRECCQVGPGHSVVAAELYAAWCNWCRDNGRDHFGTTQTFGRDLGAAIPGLKITQRRLAEGGRERTYEGVQLLQEQGLARSGTRAEPLYSQFSYYRDDPGPVAPPTPSHPYAQWHK